MPTTTVIAPFHSVFGILSFIIAVTRRFAAYDFLLTHTHTHTHTHVAV